MARLFQTGFELNSTTIEGSGSSGTAGTYTSVTSPVSSGIYSAKMDLTSTTGRNFTYRFSTTNVSTGLYTRIKLNINANPTNALKLLSFVNSSDSRKIGVRLTTSGTLQLYNEEDGAQIGSDSSSIPTGDWFLLELFADFTTLSSTSCEAKLDGVSFASGTANIATGVNSVWAGIATVSGTTTNILYLDDFAVNNISGSFQNSWIGDSNIVVFRPNAAGDNNEFGAASSTNYQSVDETTPDDVTTYLETNGASSVDYIDDYNIVDATGTIGASDTINVVCVGYRAASSTNFGSDPIVLRIKASASGTVEESSELNLSTSFYVTNGSTTTSDRNFPLVLYDLPGASTTSWTVSDLDNAQIGFRQTSTNITTRRITAVWASVDYTPSAGLPTTQSFLSTLGIGS